MTTKIKKWGNSFGIRIPKNILEQIGLSENTEVDFTVSGNSLKIKPTEEKYPKAYFLVAK